MTKTEKLRSKIEGLEKQIADGEREEKRLAGVLAECYERDGSGAEAAHKALSRHREKIRDLIGAVSALDKRLEITAETEIAEITESVEKEFRKKRDAAAADIERSVRDISKALSGHVGTRSNAIIDQIIELGVEACDAAYLSGQSEELTRRLPDKYPAAVRNENGRVTWEGIGSATHTFAFRFHGVSPRNSQIAHDGPHEFSSLAGAI